MDKSFKESIWKQFGASIDMLENAIRLCPETLWSNDKMFWYYAYHTLFYLDYYLSLEPATFTTPPPFTLSEFHTSGAPETVYSKEELLAYLQYSRNKCHLLIAGMTNEIATQRWVNEYRDYSVFEILLYNMRHVQHHTAQMNMMLRLGINNAPKWVSRASLEL